jgi:hypothetical protein
MGLEPEKESHYHKSPDLVRSAEIFSYSLVFFLKISELGNEFISHFGTEGCSRKIHCQRFPAWQVRLPRKLV